MKRILFLVLSWNNPNTREREEEGAKGKSILGGNGILNSLLLFLHNVEGTEGLRKYSSLP